MQAAMSSVLLSRVVNFWKTHAHARCLSLFATFFLLTCALSISSARAASSNWQNDIRALVKHGGVLAVSASGTPLFSLSPDLPFMPASTLKVATASAAIDLLGADYRFPTDFYLDRRSGTLFIKGYGDPLLTSEQLEKIAVQLTELGATEVKAIVLDDSFYANVEVPGASQSLNPYDTRNGALLANFNTIAVTKSKNGAIVSAEPQTPTTALTELLGKSAPIGTSRINLAAYPKESVLYVGHLMKAFLEKHGVSVSGKIVLGTAPNDIFPMISKNNQPLTDNRSGSIRYRHVTPSRLSDILKSLLEYSTNFTANQVYLHLGALSLGAPATLHKSNQTMLTYLKQNVGLKNVAVEEGSGLSRGNQITPREMIKLLDHFAPHKHLLKEKNGARSKTGTLTGVSALAGYFHSETYGEVRFAILLNQAGNQRDKVLAALKKGLAH